VADLRADAAARRLLPLLPQSPVITSTRAADLVGVSERAARTALQTLTDRKILSRVALDTPQRGRAPEHYAATALLDATAAWAR